MASRVPLRFLAIAAAALTLAACQESDYPKAIRPIPGALQIKMEKEGMRELGPVLIRLFKEESALEVWKQKRDGKYALLKTYEICKWSGVLGPKIKEGDRQAPEGFYIVTPSQMNPDSKYYLAFNIGYPNAFDRALGRTGSNLMVHGACSSAGCYSMTDADAGELFRLARDSFRGGQTEFQIQAFPFRMTAEKLAKHRDDPNMPFWRMLKVGYDHFEVTRQPPKIDVCDKRYVFNADAGEGVFRANASCPAYKVPEQIASAVAAKQAADEKKFSLAVARIEADALKAAADKAKQAEKATLVAAKEADKAARPSLFSRWFGRGPAPDATAVAGPTVVPPLPRLAPAAGAPRTPIRVAAAPVRKLAATKPNPGTVLAAAEPIPPKANPAATAAATKSAIVVPAAEPAAPTAPIETASAAETEKVVGTFVKRKFMWPDEPAPVLKIPGETAPSATPPGTTPN